MKNVLRGNLSIGQAIVANAVLNLKVVVIKDIL